MYFGLMIISGYRPCFCFFQPSISNAWESSSRSPMLFSENGIVVNLSGI